MILMDKHNIYFDWWLFGIYKKLCLWIKFSHAINKFCSFWKNKIRL